MFNVSLTEPRRRQAPGFTLLEVLLAISLLGVVSAITYMSFATVVTGWRKGMSMVDKLHHGDLIIEQLVMALRSAYYPDVKGQAPLYGFTHEDEGNGPYSSDVISWVKLGSALVGQDCPFVGSPHRVKFSVETDDEGDGMGVIRAWQLFGQPEDFDPDDVPPRYLSRHITGFNCRAAYKKVDDDIDWQDEWENTNRLPTVIELTFYLQPFDKDDPPIEIKRILGIPVAPLSWR